MIYLLVNRDKTSNRDLEYTLTYNRSYVIAHLTINDHQIAPAKNIVIQEPQSGGNKSTPTNTTDCYQ